MSGTQDQLIADILSLQNSSLDVRKVEDNIYDLKTHSEAKGWTGKVAISFSGRALLDDNSKQITYWDMIKKTSSGWGGENMGVSGESYSISGMERSGKGGGTLPGGEQYSYDYGKVREQMRSIAEKNGWKFKVTLIKPKWWKGFFG